jgi:hypothetical protein
VPTNVDLQEQGRETWMASQRVPANVDLQEQGRETEATHAAEPRRSGRQWRRGGAAAELERALVRASGPRQRARASLRQPAGRLRA